MIAKKINLHIFKNIKTTLIESFCVDWLKQMYKFVILAMNFEKMNEQKMKFIKCECFQWQIAFFDKFYYLIIMKFYDEVLIMISNIFLQIVIFQSLKKLHSKNIKNRRFVKYIKQYLINIYDDFYFRREFFNQSIEWYSKRTMSWTFQYRKKSKMNVNENSNMIFTNYEIETNNDEKQRNRLVDFVFVHDENDLMIIDENRWKLW